MAIRLVLADDHAQFRAYLADLLNKQPGLSVVAQAEDGRALLRALQTCAAHVAIVDVEMRGMGGVQAVPLALAGHPALRVLALSMHDDAAFVSAMVAAGAHGYVLKSDPLPQLVQAIRSVAAGRPGFSASVRAPMRSGGSAE
ncbi:response regulator [Piscinibacter sp.]|uniref:response regulator n=1 Tax=Piscinibacter sp. TaxID=1903157 RepID=UPI002C08C080|nr:response regulator transcription factor [Albitalea sp.]HUG26175.1 response regulator transcription factor [Albitalea sp.]